MQVSHIHRLLLRDCASQSFDEDFQVLQVEVVMRSILSQENIQSKHNLKLCLN
jgi:hypothetical protein